MLNYPEWKWKQCFKKHRTNIGCIEWPKLTGEPSLLVRTWKTWKGVDRNNSPSCHPGSTSHSCKFEGGHQLNNPSLYFDFHPTVTGGLSPVTPRHLSPTFSDKTFLPVHSHLPRVRPLTCIPVTPPLSNSSISSFPVVVTDPILHGTSEPSVGSSLFTCLFNKIFQSPRSYRMLSDMNLPYTTNFIILSQGMWFTTESWDDI